MVCPVPAAGVRLYYVGIRVRDLRRSLRFYKDALGLREKIRGDHRRLGKGVWVGLEDPRSKAKLELNWYPSGSRFAKPYRAGEGLDHIGFLLGRVPRETLEAEYSRLLQAGARPTDVTPESSSGWQACVLDPDGNWIELFRWPVQKRRRRPSARARPHRGRK